MHLSRRHVLAGLGTASMFNLPARAGTAGPPPATSGLRDHAARAGIIYGAAIAEAIDDPAFRALYETETRIVTTDWALKFGALRPSRDVFEFGTADAIVDWAHRKGLFVRGHALVWNEANGDWLNRCSAREVQRIFDDHIERTVSRYAGRIHSWDVINEPFWPDHGEPGGFRKGPWYNAMGPGYIPRALKRVRAIDPHAVLCINEAHCQVENDWGNAIRPCLAQYVTELRQSGTPLDAIGLQGHLVPSLPHDDERFATYLRRLAANDVDLHITELDVNDTGLPDAIEARDQAVASCASGFLDAALSVPAVKMVITWELADKWSFYYRDKMARDPDATRRPRPLPFDEEGQRKPMWTAMAAAFDRRARRTG